MDVGPIMSQLLVVYLRNLPQIFFQFQLCDIKLEPYLALFYVLVNKGLSNSNVSFLRFVLLSC